MTANATDGHLRVLRLTASGEAENPEVQSTRGRYALKGRNAIQNRKLDGGA